MKELSDRRQSSIPTPVSRAGVSQPAIETAQSVYDGTTLSYYLLAQGGDPRGTREFLQLNRIGRVFTDLRIGRKVIIQKRS
jgi:hypothetical protein